MKIMYYKNWEKLIEKLDSPIFKKYESHLIIELINKEIDNQQKQFTKKQYENIKNKINKKRTSSLICTD